jgi:hypothetical protein
MRNEAFKEYLKNHTDQYYMYPSDKVWLNISKHLKVYKRFPNKYNPTLILVLVSVTLVYNFLLHNGTAATRSANNLAKIEKQKTIANQNSNIVLIAPKNTIVSGKSNNINFKPTTTNNFFNTRNNESVTIAQNLVAKNNLIPNQLILFNNNFTSPINTISNKEITNDIEPLETIEGEVPAINDAAVLSSSINISNEAATTTNDNNVKNNHIEKPNSSSALVSPLAKETLLAKTIKFKKVGAKKLYWSNYITPLASFSTLRTNNPLGSPELMKSYYKQRPKIGFELGTQLQYAVSDNMLIYVGAQLNGSSYTFTGFKNNSLELTVVNSRVNTRTLSFDSTFSNLRTFGPNEKATTIQNKFVSISFPIGFQKKMFDINNSWSFQLNAAALPTYLVHNSGVAPNADLKNYIEVPEYVRRWNMNASLGFMFVYRNGKNNFIVGPQLKRQLLSTYQSNYSISENISDVGFRIGFSRAIK